jgi:hypothetical protein
VIGIVVHSHKSTYKSMFNGKGRDCLMKIKTAGRNTELAGRNTELAGRNTELAADLCICVVSYFICEFNKTFWIGDVTLTELDISPITCK